MKYSWLDAVSQKIDPLVTLDFFWLSLKVCVTGAWLSVTQLAVTQETDGQIFWTQTKKFT